MMRYKPLHRKRSLLCRGTEPRPFSGSLAMENHEKTEKRGLLQDAGRVIDSIQELILKVDVLLTKVEEALDLLKENNGSD